MYPIDDILIQGVSHVITKGIDTMGIGINANYIEVDKSCMNECVEILDHIRYIAVRKKPAATIVLGFSLLLPVFD